MEVRPTKRRKLEAYFPDDSVYEIMTTLPVKSLLRFKCVCKWWYSTIENPRFIYNHRFKREHVQYIYEQDAGQDFIYKDKEYGFLLEMNKSSNKYRVRNPFTRQIVDLPDPQRPSHKIYLDKLINKIGEVLFKVVSISHKDGTPGCEILSVGVDENWRLLELPSFHQVSGLNTEHGSQAVFFVQFNNNRKSNLEVKVTSLDLKKERFHVCSSPQHSFRCLKEVPFVYWKGCLAFADVVGENLNGYVLEDLKRGKWSHKIVIPLGFLKGKSDTTEENNNSKPKFKLAYSHGFVFKWNKSLITYNDKLGKITHTRPLGTGSGTIPIRASLTTIKENHRKTKEG